jgi:hypothetical protein
LLNAEQLANPVQIVAAFFQQCSLDYVQRELCDFLDAGIGYDGSYPNGFTPWQAWMTYNHVLCLVEAAHQLYIHQEMEIDEDAYLRQKQISLIASQINGKILFPKKMEEAKRILDHARFEK